MLFFVALAASLPYLPTLSFEYVWDDRIHILSNRDTGSPRAALGYFLRTEGDYYRPLVFSSYALEHALFGTSPALSHAVNVVLHVATAGLFYEVARATLGSLPALGAALLFSLHPAHVEAVAYVSGRTDLFVAFGALLASFGALRARGLAAPVFLVLGAVTAVFAKETGYLVPAVLLFVPGPARWRDRVRLVVPAALVVCLALFLRPNSEDFVDRALGVGVSASALLVSFETYARVFLWPSRLVVDRLVFFGESNPAAGAALLFAFSAFTVFFARRSPGLRFWAVWFWVFFLPVSNLVPLYPAISEKAVFVPDHNLYVPSLGLAALLGAGFESLVRSRTNLARPLLATAFLLLLLAAGRTGVRVLDWRNEEVLFTRAAQQGARSPRVWLNLGNVLAEKGKIGPAVEAYRSGLRRAPDDAALWANLGVLLHRQGKLDEAERAYRRSLAREPDALTWRNLGLLLAGRGRRREAARAFREALRLDPSDARVRRALALLGEPARR